MSKRQIVRGMWVRGTEGESSKRMALSYIARRLGYTIKQTVYFINALNRMGLIASYYDKKSVVFFG